MSFGRDEAQNKIVLKLSPANKMELVRSLLHIFRYSTTCVRYSTIFVTPQFSLLHNFRSLLHIFRYSTSFVTPQFSWGLFFKVPRYSTSPVTPQAPLLHIFRCSTIFVGTFFRDDADDAADDAAADDFFITTITN